MLSNNPSGLTIVFLNNFAWPLYLDRSSKDVSAVTSWREYWLPERLAQIVLGPHKLEIVGVVRDKYI